MRPKINIKEPMSLKAKIICMISVLAFLLFIGLPAFDRITSDPCIHEIEETKVEPPPSDSACFSPFKTNGLWHQGKGQFCYLASVMNSNILGGMDDSDDEFFLAMQDCLASYNVTLCDLENGVRPGSYEEQMIHSCKILKMNEFGEPIGLDSYTLTVPWWEIGTRTHKITDLCKDLRKAVKKGGGAWATIGGLASGNSHTVSVTDVRSLSDGTYCQLTISNPNYPEERTILTVNGKNRITETEDQVGTAISAGKYLEAITIEKKI